MPFHKNVFVNCPFDSDYLSLLRPLLFTVIDLGFAPKIALESPDSGRPRIDRIITLVQQSKFAIHDLSRLQASKGGELFRLNMPFELGIDIGCRLFKGANGPASDVSSLRRKNTDIRLPSRTCRIPTSRLMKTSLI